MEIASKLFEFTEYEDTSLAGIWGYKLPYTLGSRNLQIGSSPYKDLQNERNKKYGVVDNIEAFSTPLKTIGREVEGITVDTNGVRCLSSNKNITASIISSLRFGERISSLNYWRVTAGLLSAVPISPDLTYLVSTHTYKYLVPILGSTNQTPNNIVLFSRIKLYDDRNISQWVQRMYSRGYVGFVNYIYGDIFDFQSLKKINPSRSVCILSLEDYKQLKLQDGENLFSHLSPLVSFVLCNKKDLPCLPENYYSFSVNAEVTALIHSEEVYKLGDRSVIAPKLVLMSIGLSGILFIHRYAAGLGRRIRKFILG